jgi:hypothetical protein
MEGLRPETETQENTELQVSGAVAPSTDDPVPVLMPRFEGATTEVESSEATAIVSVDVEMEPAEPQDEFHPSGERKRVRSA